MEPTTSKRSSKQFVENIKEKRLREIKAYNENIRKIARGHGEYAELPKASFINDFCRESDVVIVHFFLKNSPHCDVMDFHLKILASVHLETRFCKIDIDKFPGLCEKHGIECSPTLLIFKNREPEQQLTGFTDLDYEKHSSIYLASVLREHGFIDKESILKDFQPYVGKSSNLHSKCCYSSKEAAQYEYSKLPH